MSKHEELVACFRREDFPQFHTGKLSHILFPMPREEAHRTNTPHIIARIYAISTEGFFLIQRRSPDRRSHPGLFTDSASGHIHYHPRLDYEYIEREAFREMEEEMGTKVVYGRMFDINLEEFRSGGCELAYNFIAIVEHKCQPDPIETAPESGFYTKIELERLLQSREFVPIARQYWRNFLDAGEFDRLRTDFQQRAEISKDLSNYPHLTTPAFRTTDNANTEPNALMKENQKPKIGAIVGRFQPFHQGHFLLISKALECVDHLKIGIGSMQYDHSVENPFTFVERKEMILRSLRDAGVEPARFSIFGIPDLHDMVRWTQSLIDIMGDFDVFFGNNEWTRQLLLKHGKSLGPVLKFDFDRYNGTNIRTKIKQQTDLENLLPPAVFTYLNEIDGFSRIRNL
jgi:nicotinamide-nucleotide adenylyltransferase